MKEDAMDGEGTPGGTSPGMPAKNSLAGGGASDGSTRTFVNVGSDD